MSWSPRAPGARRRRGLTLTYQESQLTGLEGTLTTFQIEPDRVTLLRVGEVNSQMVFEEGRRHLSMYDTPYGALSIGVNTRRMRSDLSASGGSIEIDYAIEIDHAVAGQNLFRIQVRERSSPSGSNHFIEEEGLEECPT